MSDSENSLTPPEVREAANTAVNNLLPVKSKYRYEQEYKKFVEWSKLNKIKKYSENCLLAYFQNVSHRKSLWSLYSMIKSCLSIKHNIDISKYTKLLAFLKKKTEHHIPKKSAVLQESEINKFIAEAPDKEYLLVKVALIMGISGACRREELCKMIISHITFKDDIILIAIPGTKTNKSRSFVVTKREWLQIIQNYLAVRSKCITQGGRVFYTYRNGKCVNAPMGINTLGKVPSVIAQFLQLENPKMYTGHCFRRTSATLLSDKGGDLLALKRHGGWSSSAVAESYVEESFRKIQVAETLTEPGPSTLFQVQSSEPHASTSTQMSNQLLVPGVSISNCTSCTINVQVYNQEK